MVATALPVFVEALTLALAVRFLRMALKNRRRLDPNSRSLDDLRTEYYIDYTTRMLAYAIFALPFMPLWYFGLRWVSKWRGNSLGAAQFVVLPSDVFWMVPAFFAGLFTAILLVNRHYKRKLGTRYPEFEMYCDLQHRQQLNLLSAFDLKTVEAWVGAVTIFATGSFIAFGLNAHTRFTEQAIMIKTGWTLFENGHQYNRVRALAAVNRLTTPSGKIRESPHYAILFDDGTTWSTSDDFWSSGLDRDQQIMEFVATKANKPIQQVDLIEDLHLAKQVDPR
jgi:hypothetical protein